MDLGERLNSIQEVSGSIPFIFTIGNQTITSKNFGNSSYASQGDRAVQGNPITSQSGKKGR